MIFDTSTQYYFFEVKYEHEAFVSVEQLVCFIKLFPEEFLPPPPLPLCFVLWRCMSICVVLVFVYCVSICCNTLSSSEDDWGM
jgi:hypothetical protein